jgi:hypothetical protein
MAPHLTPRLTKRLVKLAAGAVLLALAVSPGPALAATAHAGPAATVTTTAAGVRTLTGKLRDGATYLIQVPSHWNHTLFLYSHFYVTAGSPNPAYDAFDPITQGWMLSHGYALAGSSYATTGWAVQQAMPDQIATLGVFGRRVGKPRRTIAWGHSLGGLITAGLIQDYPGRFTAALPMCGVLSGGVAEMNTTLDAAFAVKTLLAPSLQLVNITNPAADLAKAERAAQKAQASTAGRARLALAAALYDLPGWFTTLSPEPARTDYAAQEANQYLGLTEVDFPGAFLARAEIEGRAGGNPSWNTGVNYSADLARSADAREVRALYRAAHLSLRADLAALAHAARISADPRAVRYLARNVSFTGKLSVPVLTVQTTGDPDVAPEEDQAYASAAAQAGDSALLRETFVSRAGHCAFTPAETIAAVQVLMHRLDSGRWDGAALTPAAMNAAAAALGPAYNVYPNSSGKLVQVAPAFLRYRPALFPRPYNLQAR